MYRSARPLRAVFALLIPLVLCLIGCGRKPVKPLPTTTGAPPWPAPGWRIGPRLGTVFPAFEVATLDGKRLHSDELLRRGPLLLNIASCSCPISVGAADTLKRLHRRFGREVQFVTLYVQEEHPNLEFPLVNSFEEKLAHARSYQTRCSVPWTVAVDNQQEELHTALGGEPAAAFLIRRDGTLVRRVPWANQEAVVVDGIIALRQSG
jgi:hypothetical protein